MTITVDTRERYPYRFAHQGAGTIRATVAAGDYAIHGADGRLLAAVERKSLENLASTLSDGTLAFQLQRLAELPLAAIVIEARYSALFKLEHVNGNWLADQLTRLQVRHPGIPIVFADTRRHAEDFSLRRYYVLFFIELGSRRVHLAGCTTNPTGAWVTQQARNISFTSLLERTRFLIHDRDSKFTAAFDEVFRSEGINVIQTPIRAPQANAYAERFVRTVRAECLDWLLILGRRHLEHVLRTYTSHYNAKRPHRALAVVPPEAGTTAARPANSKIERDDLLGGLIHEYRAVA